MSEPLPQPLPEVQPPTPSPPISTPDAQFEETLRVLQRMTQPAETPNNLLAQVSALISQMQGLRARLIDQLPPSKAKPWMTEVERLAEHPSDATLLYTLRLVTAEGSQFVVDGRSTFSDVTDDALLASAQSTFVSTLQSHVFNPAVNKFQKYLQPHIKRSEPKAPAYGGPHLLDDDQPFQEPDDSPFNDQGLLSSSS